MKKVLYSWSTTKLLVFIGIEPFFRNKVVKKPNIFQSVFLTT